MMKTLLFLLFPVLTFAQAMTFEIQGHRGARGLLPENTIPSFKKAIDLGVQTIELDVVISKDKKVVVSHDPYFNPAISTAPNGEPVTKNTSGNLYLLDYKEIKKYDVGMKPHPDFPRQQKLAAQKPLLADLLDAAEAEAQIKNRTIHYNIEIKSKKGTDNTHHPDPAIFVEKLVTVLKQKNIVDRCIVQSFDMRPLQVLHRSCFEPRRWARLRRPAS